jgi:hypothetical protein
MFLHDLRGFPIHKKADFQYILGILENNYAFNFACSMITCLSLIVSIMHEFI